MRVPCRLFPPTLRQLFVAAYLVGMVGLTASLIILIQGRLKAHFHQELTETGQALAESLVTESRLALLQGTAANVQAHLNAVARYPSVSGVIVATPDNSVIALSGRPPSPPITEALADDGWKQTRAVERSDQLLIVAPVLARSQPAASDTVETRNGWLESPETHLDRSPDAQEVGYVALTLTKAKLEADLQKINRHILAVMVVGLLAFTGLLLWLLRQLTHPIKALARTMADPETINQCRPVAVYGVREARAIARAFNKLIGEFAEASRALSDSKTEIERQNMMLAQTVAEQVAELKRQNAQLDLACRDAKAASRAKSEFIATVSHEMRAPLHVLLGNIDLLKDTPLDDHQELLRAMMQEEGERLLMEIESILDFSRLGAHRFVLKTRSFRPRPLLERAVKPFEHRARAKNLQLDLKIDARMPEWLCADGEQIGRILGILLDNALKFTARGRIDARAAFKPSSPRSGQLRLYVRDTGIGILKNDQPKIFEPFTQADSSTTRKYNGTGLGLAILSKLVELMGGFKDFKSEPGKGSIFYVEVPLSLSDPASELSCEPNAPQDQAFQHAVASRDEPVSERHFDLAFQPAGARILVVDDERNARLYARLALHDLNADLMTAASGAEALALCERQRFDLILMDIRMQNMDGLETAREIRKNRSTLNARTLLVGLTADAVNFYEPDLQEAGFDDCLIKPIRRDHLVTLFTKFGVGQPPKGTPLRQIWQKYKYYLPHGQER